MRYVNSTSGNPYVSSDTGELCRIAGMRSFPSPDASVKKRVLSAVKNARTDVSLSISFCDDGLDYLIGTAVDAIQDETGTVFEVITGPSGNRLSPSQVHSGRLLLSAFIYASNTGLFSVTACASVTDPDGNDVKNVSKTYTFDELSSRFSLAVGCARRLALNEQRRVLEVLPTLERLPFPHKSLRPGQKELIETVHLAVKQGERLFAQAPTGTGKTVSVLYGALRAAGKADIRRIFYLTAKASTGREAYASASLLSKAGAGVRTVVLSAKEQVCPCPKTDGGFLCDPERCPLMRGYRENAAKALDSLLGSYKGFPASAIAAAAAEYGVCPYELSLDLSEFCDIIICDYNYVFDPAVRLRRYFSPEAGDCGRSAFLIDEAHNLTERARDIFSARLCADDLLALRGFASENPDVTGACDDFAAALDACRPLCADTLVRDENGLENGWFFAREQIPSLSSAVSALLSVTEKYYFSHKSDVPAASAAAALLRKLRKWQDASDSYSEKYRTYIVIGNGKISATLFCLDPSGRLSEGLSLGHSSVFFSATLTPSDYFADVLGGGRDFMSLALPSPFPRDNLFVCCVTSVDTRYENREKSVKRIVYAIAAAASAKPGNYIVFFPSYAYLKPVAEAFASKYPKVEINVQKRGMTRADREAFLDFFKDDENRLRIGFCVMGGSFSEGIDLPGGRLIGTVIVGVGLPGLSAERNMIRDYYDSSAGRGYDYAYTYPGMNSVLQAAGRVIRRDTDRGVVILCDDRYATPAYRGMMPEHWKGLRVIEDIKELPSDLRDFWSGKMPEPTPPPVQETDFCEP